MAYVYILKITTPGTSPATYYMAASYGRTTSPTDTPANTYIPGKLTGPINFSMSLFDGVEPVPAQRASVGALVIDDPDGELDVYATYAWDGMTVEILRGQHDAETSTFTTVAELIASGLNYGDTKKEIPLRSVSWKLEQGLLHEEYYAGTGLGEGDAALTGRWKPYAVGSVFNVDPLLIDTTNLIYQLSCTSINGVSAVRDGGVALAFDADYANYAALVAAATLGAGEYATCLALGLVRVFAVPTYSIRVDFTGDADTISGQTYPSTRAQIAKRIAFGRGTLKLASGDIDGTSVTDLDTDQPNTIGLYWDSPLTKAAALDQVMRGCLGYWFLSLTGTLYMGVIPDMPGSLLVQDYTFVYPSDMGQGEPTMYNNYMPPRYSTFVSWGRNYGPMPELEIAGAVSAADRAIYQNEWRYGEYTDATISDTWPSSRRVYIEGGYTTEANADTEASRQQVNVLGDGYRMERWRFTINADPFVNYLGKIIKIDDFERYGGAGFGERRFLCVGQSFASGVSITLELWG